MKLLFPSNFSSLAVRRVTVALLLITSCIVKHVSATSQDNDASSQSSLSSSSSSITNEDKDLMNYDHTNTHSSSEDNFTTSMINNNNNNNIMTRPTTSNRILLKKSNVPNGLSDQWLPLGDLIRGKAAGDSFGYSVATSKSGEFIIVGLRNSDGDDSGLLNSGSAKIYQYNEVTEKWDKVGGEILGEKGGDESGYSVDINETGDVVIIGSPSNDGRTGHARVFRLINGQWYQQGQDIFGVQGDQFGISVAISRDGGKVIVGALQPYVNGYAKVYEYIADTQRWEQLGLTIVGSGQYDYFGISVDMNDSGDVIVIGATNNDDNGADSGHARVYRYIAGQWVQQGQDLKGKKAGDGFGWGLAISRDGKKVIIGGPKNDSGYAQVYEYKDDIERWEQVGGDINGERAGDYLGSSVDINSTGDAIIVGAPNHDGNGQDSGRASIYQLIDSQWVMQGEDLVGRSAGERFGLAVAISGNGAKVMVGNPVATNGGVNSGDVRAFVLASFCTDSPLMVLLGSKKKSARSCEFIAEKHNKFCPTKKFKTHCPYACGSCEKFRSSDSTGSFVFEGEVTDCDSLSNSSIYRVLELCQIDSINETCRKTCDLFCKDM